MIRPATNEDLRIVNGFHNKRSSHELKLGNTLYHGVYEKDKKIIAYGAVKEFHEMVISVNDATAREKKEAIDELYRMCLQLAIIKGETNLYAFAENGFAEILKEHFGFQEIDRKILGIRVGG